MSRKTNIIKSVQPQSNDKADDVDLDVGIRNRDHKKDKHNKNDNDCDNGDDYSINADVVVVMIRVIMFTMPVLKWKSRPQEERVLFTIAVMAGLMQAIIMVKMIEMIRVHALWGW